MKLKDLIQDFEAVSIHGDTEQEVSALAFDSRKVESGTLFIAITGTGVDGHEFIPSAIASGCKAIVCERMPDNLPKDISCICVENSRLALALLASAWYGYPSREIRLTGVTGTNGKTTIATLLYKVNTGLGFKTGILTTIEILINGRSYPASHTTPDPLQINAALRKMVDAGCSDCFMEVSSHAASQHRIAGLEFNGAVFTNLTHDHLDYHKSFREYLEAKKSFFDQLDANAFALVNADDKNGLVMLQNSKAKKYQYSLKKMVDFRAKVMEPHFDGMHLQINDKEVWVRLTGFFNASNILAVYGMSMLYGHDADEVLQALSNVASVNGRFEVIRGVKGGIGIVDYAHTDDALKNVLETIHEVDQERKELITVVGAGGDRDRTKRPKMAAVASKYSSKLILTSDNPRSEDALEIISEMEKGVPVADLNKMLKIVDREEAIKTACMLAGPEGIVLVAGKGHEKYQEIKGVRKHFDDKELVTKYLM